MELDRTTFATFLAESQPVDAEPRGVARIRAIIANASAMTALVGAGQELVRPEPPHVGQLTHRVGRATALAALREAFQRLRPEAEAESLVLDVDVAAGRQAGLRVPAGRGGLHRSQGGADA